MQRQLMSLISYWICSEPVELNKMRLLFRASSFKFNLMKGNRNVRMRMYIEQYNGRYGTSISDFIQKPYRKENSGKVLVDRSYFPEKRKIRPELVALAKRLSIEDELDYRRWK